MKKRVYSSRLKILEMYLVLNLLFFSMVVGATLPFYLTPKLMLIGRSGCSFYFKSINNSDWSGARDACRSQLGSNATLVNIESFQERDRIRQMFDDDYDGVSTFWVDGGYNTPSSEPPGKQCFLWFTANQCVGEDSVIDWDGDRPYGDPHKRLQIIYKGFDEPLRFRAASLHNKIKYICEFTIKPEYCNMSK